MLHTTTPVTKRSVPLSPSFGGVGHHCRVTLLSLLLLPAFPLRLAGQCPDGSSPPCAHPVAHTPAPNSVAVLYFDNLSRDTADAYLADGLTEEIIIRLGQVQRLEVKSRFEVQRLRGRAALDPPALGRSLNSAYLVSGSVQRAGDRVRLRVALVRAATRAQVWGDVIDRATGDLLSVESEIALEVARAVTGQVVPDDRARLARAVTSDPVAYEEYLRGLPALNGPFEEAAIRGAISHFGRAIARDSGFAAAFAALADAWTGLADGFVSPTEGYGRARVAASQALARDSSQTAAYTALAAAVLALDLDAGAAERFARRALALEPRDAEARNMLSQALIAEGRLDGSLVQASEAWQVDSLEVFNGAWLAMVLLYSHQLDRVAALLPRLRAAGQPADADAVEGSLLAAQGNWRGARRLLNWRYYGGWSAGTFVRALLATGDTAAARTTVDSMLAARSVGYYNPVALAKAYAALGDIDYGIEWLRRAFDERTIWLRSVRVDDELAPLRADPRYAALDQQLRF